MIASGEEGGESRACRDGDHIERSKVLKEGIRFPETMTGLSQLEYYRDEEDLLCTSLVLFWKKKAVPAIERNVKNVIKIGKSMLV
jgi:hypothetical protein